MHSWKYIGVFYKSIISNACPNFNIKNIHIKKGVEILAYYDPRQSGISLMLVYKLVYMSATLSYAFSTLVSYIRRSSICYYRIYCSMWHLTAYCFSSVNLDYNTDLWDIVKLYFPADPASMKNYKVFWFKKMWRGANFPLLN